MVVVSQHDITSIISKLESLKMDNEGLFEDLQKVIVEKQQHDEYNN